MSARARLQVVLLVALGCACASTGEPRGVPGAGSSAHQDAPSRASSGKPGPTGAAAVRADAGAEKAGSRGETVNYADAGSDADADPPALPKGWFEGTQSGLVFDPPRGTHDTPFDLTITHASARSVRYTLDCSDPRTSPSAITAALPLTLRVDPEDTTNRFLAPGYIVRATVGDAAAPPQSVVTHSYIFPTRVLDLSPDGQSPGAGWPAPRASDGTLQAIDYGMDPDVTRAAAYKDALEPSLRSLPNLSLVTELPNLWDETRGIYTHAENSGVQWERMGSLELVNHDQSPNFQANLGVRIRGYSSREPNNPKHSFRGLFKALYGTPKLKFPLFGSEGPDTFDKIDLRTEQNYAWNRDGDAEFNENTMTRDVFSRDLQRELGRPHTRSRYYHLYLDGVYWGLYQTQERVDGHYGETYFGSDDANYDVIKPERNEAKEVVATEGDLTAWNALWQLTTAGFEDDAAYYRLEGKDSTGERDAALAAWVDVDNLIDYMLVIFYTANFDAPISKWFQNNQANNFYAIRDRVAADRGFIFLAHDSEHSLHADPLLITQGVDEDRVNIADASGALDATGQPSDVYRMNVTDVKQSNPQWLHHRLTSNAKYRQRFAARARVLLADQGALSPSAVLALHQTRVAQIERAIVAESARWGDSRRPERPRTRDEDWTPAVQRVVSGFLAKRTPIVIEQLRKAGLY